MTTTYERFDLLKMLVSYGVVDYATAQQVNDYLNTQNGYTQFLYPFKGYGVSTLQNVANFVAFLEELVGFKCISEQQKYDILKERIKVVEMKDESEAYDGAEHDVTETSGNSSFEDHEMSTLILGGDFDQFVQERHEENMEILEQEKYRGFRFTLWVSAMESSIELTDEMTQALSGDQRISNFDDALTVIEYMVKTPGKTLEQALDNCFGYKEIPDMSSIDQAYAYERTQVKDDFFLTKLQWEELNECEWIDGYKEMIPYIEYLDQHRGATVQEAIDHVLGVEPDDEHDSWSQELHENMNFENAGDFFGCQGSIDEE